MPEWLKDLIVAIGGGSVVLIGILTVFKKLFIKFFETGIESSFEKSMEKYRHQLSRSSRAYEFLLDKEMSFYEKMEPIYAELIPLVQDLLYALEKTEDNLQESKWRSFRSNFLRYCDLIKIMKNETLSNEVYIPIDIFISNNAIVIQMQESVEYWGKSGKYLYEGLYDSIEFNEGKKFVDKQLMSIAVAQTANKKRLKELANL